jgi:hypothetical protein
MERIHLPTVDASTEPPESPLGPSMPRSRLKRLTARVVRAKCLKSAAHVLLDAAATMSGHWRRYALKLAQGLEDIGANPDVFDTPFPVFMVKGNSKLPFTAFSALPEFTCPGAGDCLRWCYSFTSWRYPAAWARQVQNTLLLMHARHVVAHHFARLDHGAIVRLYVDGDFDSPGTVEFWFDLLKARPDIKAYGYSKSWDLLWEYAQTDELPENYRLNLSSGGRSQTVTADQMRTLPITRGEFVAVPISYRPKDKKGKVGSERYDDPEYHRAVRRAAAEQGIKAFSCPGRCGECCGSEHACGSARMAGVTICIGIH